MKNSVATTITSLLAFAGAAFATEEINEYNMDRIFDPSPAQLEAEAKGRVLIYDKMRDTVVERALKEEFDRVQSMMFVRTVETDDRVEPVADEPPGQPADESDDCE